MTSALPSILEDILSSELKSPGKSSSARLPRGMKLVQFKKKLCHSRPGETCIAGVCCDRVISLACFYCETEKMQPFFFSVCTSQNGSHGPMQGVPCGDRVNWG